MMQLLSKGDGFEVAAVKLEQASWGRDGVDHVAQGPDDELWAVGAREVLVRDGASKWRRVGLDKLEQGACLEWEQYGTRCQEVIPLGEGRAVVLRPNYSKAVSGELMLGTQVLALSAEKPEPLGALELPGFLLGPSVGDASGGFWVMIRRSGGAKEDKPLRGYLHFTSDGEWRMWNNSGEQIDGVEYRGASAFEAALEPRKMSADGAGGFFAASASGELWRVDRAGGAKVFGAGALSCGGCRVLSLSWDPLARELHVLTALWSDGAKGRQVQQGLTWWRLDGGGALIKKGVVPADRECEAGFYERVMVKASKGQAWLLGQDTWLHQDGRRWTALLTPGVERRIARSCVPVGDAFEATSSGGSPLSMPLMIGGGVLALTGAGLIIAGTMSASSAQDEFAAGRSTQRRLVDDIAAADRLKLFGYIGVGVGVTTFVFGLLLSGGDEVEEPSSWRLMPGPGELGVGVGWSF
jgi:hypothetical protein